MPKKTQLPLRQLPYETKIKISSAFALTNIKFSHFRKPAIYTMKTKSQQMLSPIVNLSLAKNCVNALLLSGIIIVSSDARAQDPRQVKPTVPDAAYLQETATAAIPSLPDFCKKLRQDGANISYSSYSKGVQPSSGIQVATGPRAGSFVTSNESRKYGEGGLDKAFLDSFPAFAKQGCRVCGVEIVISGVVDMGSQQNDGIAIIGSSKPGPQNVGAPSWTWNFPVLASVPLASTTGAFTKTISISGSNWSSWILSAPNPSLDIYVQDDTTINSITVHYYTY